MDTYFISAMYIINIQMPNSAALKLAMQNVGAHSIGCVCALEVARVSFIQKDRLTTSILTLGK